MKVATACAAAGLVLTGCGAGDELAEKTTEKALEKAMEAQGDVDLDLDTDGEGSMTIEGEGGSLTFGGGGELPDWAPDDLPLPDTYEVFQSGRFDDSSQIHLVSPVDIDEFYEWAQQELSAAGYTIESNIELDQNGLVSRQFAANSSGQSLYVSLTKEAGADETRIGFVIGLGTQE